MSAVGVCSCAGSSSCCGWSGYVFRGRSSRSGYCSLGSLALTTPPAPATAVGGGTRRGSATVTTPPAPAVAVGGGFAGGLTATTTPPAPAVVGGGTGSGLAAKEGRSWHKIVMPDTVFDQALACDVFAGRECLPFGYFHTPGGAKIQHCSRSSSSRFLISVTMTEGVHLPLGS